MGFFDNKKNMDRLKQLENRIQYEDIRPNYPIGSMVRYEYNNQAFVISPPYTDLTKILTHQVTLGVVLEQLPDMTYVVMYKNIINQPIDPLLGNLIESDEDQAGIIVKYFNIYTNQINRYMDKLNIPRLKFMIPSNRHMDLIYNNIEIICESLIKLMPKNKVYDFIDGIQKKRIYCNIGGHIASWKYSDEEGHKEFYSRPRIFNTYFLPIFLIDLKNKHGKG